MVYRVLTIAGSDSCGGAGIQTDLKTFSALGVYGMSAITAVTAQNTTGVSMIEDISAQCVEAQIRACLSDIGCDAIKVGMLSNQAIIEAVKLSFKEFKYTNIVIDPVMVATTGALLLKPQAKTALIDLLKYAQVITPNKAEAEVLTDRRIETLQEAKAASQRIRQFTDAAILIKGIAPGKDLLQIGQRYSVLSTPWIDTTNSHGTGCTLSSAIACFLARGYQLEAAIIEGKAFIYRAIKHSLDIGNGSGPTHPLYDAWHALQSSPQLEGEYRALVNVQSL